jgi:hypothetical protein
MTPRSFLAAEKDSTADDADGADKVSVWIETIRVISEIRGRCPVSQFGCGGAAPSDPWFNLSNFRRLV